MLSEQFLQQLQSSDLVLTANRRLAIYLKKQFDLVQIAKGHQAFETLNCLPLISWVEQTFNTYSLDPRIILNDFQENLLWQDVLSASPMGDGLINVTTTAKLVKDSWGLLQNWCLDLEELNHSPSSDVQTFVFWCKQFQLKCQQLNYLSRTQILSLLTKFLMQNSQQLKLPKRIFFIGFDDLTPGIKALQTALAQNSEISTLNLQNDQEANSVRMGFFDHQEELMAMARWAYHQYQQNPVAKIGCIVPSLNQERNTVERLFYEIARAEKMSDESDTLINISAANPLSYYPIIRHTLMLLQLNFTEIDFETFSQLLRSPFIAGANIEQNQRAKCDAKLRQHGELKINVSLLAQSAALKTCPIFLQQLQAFLNKRNQQLFSLEQWALHFSEQLTNLGWPGDQSLDSTEFQITERFKKCFDEFMTMHYKNENFSFAIAYNLFQDLVSKVVFQPESRDTAIQILGLLEGTGMQFDYLWVTGLTNESWPPPAAPNPFIPIQLQKKYGMPHATCEREFQFSSNVMQRLKYNARHLVFSYAQHEGDRPIEASSLIVQYPEDTLALPPYESIAHQLYQTKQVEYLCDDLGPAIQEQVVSGGSGIFKAQAACPFQAFAKYRLRAQPLETAQMGLAASERGNLVHEILARIWSEINSHQSLCAHSDEQLQSIVIKAIDNAFENLKVDKPLTTHKRFLAIEQKRLLALITNWLVFEKQRKPFSVISCEQRQTTRIGQLEIHVQIDRIDQLENNSHLIIDYKTGKPSIADWFSDRPTDPQLPLYTILSEHEIEISGILFAQIRRDESCFKGVTAYGDVIPGSVTIDRLRMEEYQSWRDLIMFWQETMLKLADDIETGQAQVDPKNAAACLYCDLPELCRINQIQKSDAIND